MTLLRIISLGLVLAFCTSCASILRRTLGKHIYKKDFLPAPIPKDNEFYTEVPYELRDGWTIIKVRINNNPKEYSFIFDTGARCYITDSLAKELRLYPTKYKKSRDINGTVAYAGLYKIDLAIGQFNVKDVGVLSKSSFENLSNNCYPIDGILGANILNQGVFHFDSEENILHITNSIDKIPESKRLGKARLINHNWDGQSFVRIRVNEQKGKFLFDTGSGNLLLVEHKKKSQQLPVKRRIGFVGGLHSLKKDTLSFYKIESVRIGKEKTRTFSENVAISYSNSTNNLGNGILKKYLVTVDRDKRRLYLSPKKEETEKLKISNLRLDYHSGRALVTAITIDCELQKMGLSLGDTITFVNDTRTDSFNSPCAFKHFRDSLISEIRSKAIILTTRCGALEKKYIVTDNLLYD